MSHLLQASDLTLIVLLCFLDIFIPDFKGLGLLSQTEGVTPRPETTEPAD